MKNITFLPTFVALLIDIDKLMSTYTFKEQLFSLKWWQSWIYIFLGCTIMSAGFVLFANPYNIIPGGVYGTGIVLHHLFPSIQVGTFGFLFDIPLMILGIKIFGGMFGARTIVAAIYTPIVMNFLTFLIGENPADMLGGKIDLRDDVMLASIFAGILIGGGIGMVVKSQATTGGTDIIAMIMNKYWKIPLSRGIMFADVVVVLFGLIVLGDWRLPLYSLITIFVVVKMIDLILDGASYDKLIFIVSEKHEDMRSFILGELGRGATYIKSSGMYTNSQKDMIFLVVSRREISRVQECVKEIDPDSFMVIVDAYSTYGLGFKSFNEKVLN